MPAADDAPDGFVYDAADQLRHDLKSPLTTIYARAQILARSVRRSAGLDDAERARMLEGGTAIECTVREMVALVDTIGGPSPDGSADSTGMEH